MENETTVYVDLPFIERTTTGWRNVNQFATKSEAVRWLRALFGEHAVDDDGKVCLLTIEEER